MQTTITPLGPADYRLDVTAPAADLSPRFDAALRRQRGRVQMRGFRPGKAPMDLVRRQYGQDVAATLAEEIVQQAFDQEVLKNEQYDIVGRPALTTLAYDGTGDLTASIQFGVRPVVKVDGLGNTPLTRLVESIDDAEVTAEVDRLRARTATAEVAEEGYAITATDAATLDLQQLDSEGAPAAGRVEKGVEVTLDDENVQDALRNALIGAQAGDTFRVTLPHGSGDHVHTHQYDVAVKEVRRRTLPEADDAFALQASSGRHETVDALRGAIRGELVQAAQRRQRDYFESQIVEALLEKHADVAVPDAAIQLFLESFLQNVAERNNGKLPEDFDVEGFAQRMRGEAEKQARWMFIRDALVAQKSLAIEDADFDAFFEREVGQRGLRRGAAAALLRRPGRHDGPPGAAPALREALRHAHRARDVRRQDARRGAPGQPSRCRRRCQHLRRRPRRGRGSAGACQAEKARQEDRRLNRAGAACCDAGGPGTGPLGSRA